MKEKYLHHPTREVHKSLEKIIHWSIHTCQDKMTDQEQQFLTAVSS